MPVQVRILPLCGQTLRGVYPEHSRRAQGDISVGIWQSLLASTATHFLNHGVTETLKAQCPGVSVVRDLVILSQFALSGALGEDEACESNHIHQL